MKIHHFIAGSALLLATLLSGASLADPFTVTDVAGRQVGFDKPVEHVILGEGRFIYGLATIETENPFAKIVAWRNDLWQNDADAYDAYAAKFPALKDIPTLGRLTDGTLQIETVVDLHPDAILLPIGDKQAADEIGLEKMLDGVGVKLVYIDFREHILKNTEPSLHILGQLFDKPERADEVAAYWHEQMARVTDVLAEAKPEKPDVFMYRAAGYSECCGTFGTDNFGLMVDLAGGHNIGADFLPGYTGTINPEQVIASDPDIIVATGANWGHTEGVSGFVNVGPGAAAVADQSRAALAALMQNPAFTGVKAVKDDNVHAIWHQFYASPYQFVAVQRLAKWFHPDLFADLDPDATFRDFSEKFLPIDYQPGYWVSLDPED
jgi:iron complex transport system substrate-binding protein